MKTILIFLAGVFIVTGYFVLAKKTSLPIPFLNSIIQVKLIDAYSGQLISNVDVRIYSDNGIRCFTTPCNTEGQEWNGKTDSNGFISIPSKIINQSTGITAIGYKSGRDLGKDSEKITKYDWLMELDPDSKIDNFERRFKLIDSQSQKPLTNISMWITNNQNCKPPQCSDYSFSGNTNLIGNIYFPISSISGKDNTWIFVNDYKPAKSPSGWVNFKVILEKE